MFNEIFLFFIYFFYFNSLAVSEIIVIFNKEATEFSKTAEIKEFIELNKKLSAIIVRKTDFFGSTAHVVYLPKNFENEDAYFKDIQKKYFGLSCTVDGKETKIIHDVFIDSAQDSY